MPPISIDDLTPYGKYFYAKVRTGGITYQGKRYMLRGGCPSGAFAPADCLQHVSHWLLDEQQATLASRMKDRGAELDSVFAACAIKSGSSKGLADSLIRLGPEMAARDGTECAPIFATAFAISDRERLRKVVQVLGANMDRVKFGYAMSDGFKLLAAADKARIAGMLAEHLVAAFMATDPVHTQQALAALEEHMHPAHYARAMLDAFRALPDREKARVAPAVAARLFASAFAISDVKHMEVALNELLQGMGRMPWNSVLEGFYLLEETDTVRVMCDVPEFLFAAAFAIDDPLGRKKALEVLKQHADPVFYAEDMLEGFNMLPLQARTSVAAALGELLFAAAFSLGDLGLMNEQLDALIACTPGVHVRRAMLGGFDSLCQEVRDRTRAVLDARLAGAVVHGCNGVAAS